MIDPSTFFWPDDFQTDSPPLDYDESVSDRMSATAHSDCQTARERKRRRDREYVEANKDRIRAYQREKYWRERDAILAKRRAQRKTRPRIPVDPEVSKAKRRAAAKEYEIRNRDKIKARKRANYLLNKAERNWQAKLRRCGIDPKTVSPPSMPLPIAKASGEAPPWCAKATGGAGGLST